MASSVTILMPSLNEEESILKTIKKVPLGELTQLGYQVDFLLVDGGSSDKTVALAQSAGVRVISSPPGYGRQYLRGFREARGEIIVTADSDNSYPLGEIPQLLEILTKEKLDFITTNRFAGLKKGAMRFLNNWGNRGLTFLTNLLFQLSLKDSQSGMWVFRREIIPQLDLRSKGMSLSQEIKIEAFTKLKAKEVASSYGKRVGKVKLRIFKDGWGNICQLFKKRFFS